MSTHDKPYRSEEISPTSKLHRLNLEDCNKTLSMDPQKWIVPPSSLISSRKLPTISDTVYI